MSKHTFIDNKGRTWQEFTCSYLHPLDNQNMEFSIWAIDFSDAAERLKIIGEHGVVDGQLHQIIEA